MCYKCLGNVCIIPYSKCISKVTSKTYKFYVNLQRGKVIAIRNVLVLKSPCLNSVSYCARPEVIRTIGRKRRER